MALRYTALLFICLCLVLHSVLGQETAEDDTFSVKAPEIPTDGVGWASLIGRIVACLVLICFSGLFSGLTLGLLGLDLQGLEVIMAGRVSDDPDERKNAEYAATIMQIRKDGNLLLCTLLLGNVAVNSLLSILSADLTGGIIGFFLSTAFVVVFGEIIPQATCARYALIIGSKTVFLVKIIMIIIWPLAKPIATILDCILGEEVGVVHSRVQLVKLLRAHVRSNVLQPEEERVIAGVLSFREKTVETVMTPIARVFMLHMDDKLDMRTISMIFNSGHSRVPVYMRGRNDIQGVLFTKDLVLFDPKDEILVRRAVEVFSRVVSKVFPDMNLGAMLTKFKQGAGHLAVVHDVDTSGAGDATYAVVGIVTLEDIIEEILQDEIIDETDQFVEVENTKTRVKRTGADKENFTKLQMLCGLHGDDGAPPQRGSRLALDEAKVIAAHLLFNVAPFVALRSAGQGAHEAVTQLVLGSDIIEVARTLDLSGGTITVAPQHAHLATLLNDQLYTAGEASSSCTMVLEGRLYVRAGQDGFRSGASKWEMLALDALSGDGSNTAALFKPDFTATVASPTVRCLQIKASAFVALRKRQTALALSGGASASTSAGAGGGAGAGAGAGGTAECHSLAMPTESSDGGGLTEQFLSPASPPPVGPDRV